MTDQMNRRDFAGMLPALLAVAGSFTTRAVAQASTAGLAGPTPVVETKQLSSGTFKPGPKYGSQVGHESHRYLSGMLKAGNIRLEMHESIQQPGAEHEPVETNKHNEVWLMQRGVATLFINGVEHRMEAGDVGLVCAGDQHWIKNIGQTEMAYFVVTLGPPE